MAAKPSGLEAGGNHSVGSNIGVVIYLLRFLDTFFFRCIFFFQHSFAFWLISLCSHCGPFTASRDVCNDVFLV